MDIGQILKPQGIRGEVKVKALTDDVTRFSALKSVEIGGRVYRVEKVRYSGADVFIKLVGVDDRNAAEALRDKFISIDRAAAVALDDGEFFVADLVGATLCVKADEVRRIGIIKDIRSFGAADVFSVELDDGRGMSFAFIKSLCPEYDEAKNTFTVVEKVLNEVAVYDD